jgi:hypothetical protein
MLKLLSLVFTIFLSCAVNASVPITETVGQAGDFVITSREVKISTILDRVLYSAKGEALVENQLESLVKDSGAFRSAVTSVLLEVVVAIEAESFGVSSITDKEVGEAVDRAQAILEGKLYWIHLEVPAFELRHLVKRKLIAKSFLKFKTSSMTSIITDQEAEIYYGKNRLKFGVLPFASLRENIKAFLGQQQLEERLRSWFEVIKRKHKVRNLISG